MNIQVKRVAYKPTYTIGHMYIDGVFFSDTLEDPPHDVKIQDQTCIPSGLYNIILDYSNRFKRIMPHILNVPNFEGIRIHNGSTAANTSGCILVGNNSLIGQLTESREIFYKLFSILENANEEIIIEIL